MRIVFVTPEFVSEESCFDGGLANYLYRTASSLLSLGHDPIVVVSSNRNEVLDYDGIEVQRVKVGDINIRNMVASSVLEFHGIEAYREKVDLAFETLMGELSRFPWRLTSLSLIQRSHSLCEHVLNIHKERPIDIVQYASCAGTGLCRLETIPAVVRASSYQPLYDEAYGVDPNSPHSKAVAYFEKASFLKADHLFAPSQMLAAILQKELDKPVRVIESSFVLKDKANWDDLILTENGLDSRRYLLFFGTLGLLKGVKTIAECLKNLFEKYPDLYFVFVGKDMGYLGAPMMDYVYQQAGQYRNQVIYINKLHHSQLYPIIQNALAVVLPSRMDNFPNTCLEAMALGKIVVGTYATSFEQLIRDGESGILCEKDNPSDLLRAISRVLLLERNERLKIGEQAQLRIAQLQPEKVVTQLVDYYNSVIQSFNSKKNGGPE